MLHGEMCGSILIVLFAEYKILSRKMLRKLQAGMEELAASYSARFYVDFRESGIIFDITSEHPTAIIDYLQVRRIIKNPYFCILNL